MIKKCCRCGSTKPLSSFNKNVTKPDGLRPECRDCSNEYQRERRGVKAAVRADGTPAPVVDTSTRNVLRLKDENERLKGQVSELEDMALSGDRVRELIGSIEFNRVDPSGSWLRGANKQRASHGIGVLLLSDIHFDEVVRAEQIGGCNRYNREIAEKRLKNTFRNTIVCLKGHMSNPKYDGIIVNLGGDLLSGNIHDELVETNEGPITQSIVALSEILIEGIGGLADEFGKVHVPCVTGNHGRMHKKPRAKNRAWENFEWLIYSYISTYFKSDKRITFDIPEGPDAIYPVYRRNYCLTHGDQFKGGGGIGGIMVPIMRGIAKKAQRQQAIGNPFDGCLMGHWHQYVHTDSLVINGSVKGYDEYASANNFGFEHPQQALWIEHPDHRMTFRMPILCDKGE